MISLAGFSAVTALIILGILLWILLALAPAFIARKKGYSFLLFMLIAICVSFLFALVIVLFLPNKNLTISKADEDTVDKILKEE